MPDRTDRILDRNELRLDRVASVLVGLLGVVILGVGALALPGRLTLASIAGLMGGTMVFMGVYGVRNPERVTLFPE